MRFYPAILKTMKPFDIFHISPHVHRTHLYGGLFFPMAGAHWPSLLNSLRSFEASTRLLVHAPVTALHSCVSWLATRLSCGSPCLDLGILVYGYTITTHTM